MPEDDASTTLRTGEALQQWRSAERTAAVARRGRLAPEDASAAPEDAAQAALATAEAAKAALAAAALAEASATKTATSAKLVVQASRADLADRDTEVAMADIEEVEARERYWLAAHGAESSATDATED